MNKKTNPFETFKLLDKNKDIYYYSLKELEKQGIGNLQRLPISLRIILESLLRNCDGILVDKEDIKRLMQWNSTAPAKEDIPFIVSRVILQDFTGVPLLVDLAAMRDAVADFQLDPLIVEPNVPVDLIIDHSVQVDKSGTEDAFLFNLQLENKRNIERYSFLKWGQHAFKTFRVVPPGIGIVHQVNLEHIATVVTKKDIDGKTVLFPDTLVGTDSHTTMINGLGVVGWGVGGIEAEAGMLGQPVSLQTPEVIGVHIRGNLAKGITATDLTLKVTELLRKENVVGKFVEFFGEGAATLSVADRATIGNMAPEYGATMGYFPVDEKALEYLKLTGRDSHHIEEVRAYLKAQGLFGIPKDGEIDYTSVVELDLSTIKPSVAGPKRPQDRIDLSDVKSQFERLLLAPSKEGGYGKTKEELEKKVNILPSGHVDLPHITGGSEELDEDTKRKKSLWSEAEMVTNRPITNVAVDPGYLDDDPCDISLSHGSVAIAAITSCTNTSNPSVMIAAGLLAKKAVENGLNVNPVVKTSLAPGSRVVTDYLEKAGLQKYLNALGFQLVAYGCTTCIGNSGPLEEKIEAAIKDNDLIAASVLSGNRNFEARINSTIKANFLMSPPLVVAFAIAGKINIDMEKEPLGKNPEGKEIFLRDIWPTEEEIQKSMSEAISPEMFNKRYHHIDQDNPLWDEIPSLNSATYNWDPASSYIQKPPYFNGVAIETPSELKNLKEMRALAIFGDSVTTDHISPAGGFRKEQPAGRYLLSLGIKESDFNSYGSRRGNHDVMVRGTFANVRIRNTMVDKEGGHTLLMPEKIPMTIFDACEIYRQRNQPLIIFAGKDYGMGSSRDWAAKGPALLGVRAVVACSYERIHRSNLIGMGILPLQFKEGESAETLQLRGDEIFSLSGMNKRWKAGQEVELEIKSEFSTRKISLICRLDTPAEEEYYIHGGILPYVLREVVKNNEKK